MFDWKMMEVGLDNNKAENTLTIHLRPMTYPFRSQIHSLRSRGERSQVAK